MGRALGSATVSVRPPHPTAADADVVTDPACPAAKNTPSSTPSRVRMAWTTGVFDRTRVSRVLARLTTVGDGTTAYA